MRRAILQLAVLSGLVAAGALIDTGPAGSQEFIDKYNFLEKLRAVINARQSRIETASILNAMPLNQESYLIAGDLRTRCYFDFGDVERFLQLVAAGLKGVVIDPEYMRATGHGNTLAIYQNVGRFTVTGTSYEAKYEGYIILPSYSPSPGNEAEDSTQLHEAIHALAFGAGRTDLDEDGVGKDAPEYISKAFFEEQFNLAQREHRALTDTSTVVNGLVNQLNSLGNNAQQAEFNAAVQSHVGEIHARAQAYLDAVKAFHRVTMNTSDHSWENVHKLMALWRGNAKWDGLIRDTERNVAILAQLVSDAGQGTAQPDFNAEFKHFFFKKRCIPD